MTKQREKLPHVDSLIDELDQLARLLKHRDEIIEGYKMALDLGADPRAGSELGAAVMAGLSDYVPDAADPYPHDVEGKPGKTRLTTSAIYKSIARGIYGKVVAANQNLGNAWKDCSGGLMGAGVRHIKPRDKGVPNPDLLRASAEAKCKRDGHVWDEKERECKVCGDPLPRQDVG